MNSSENAAPFSIQYGLPIAQKDADDGLAETSSGLSLILFIILVNPVEKFAMLAFLRMF
jgi:hypothetical protein